MRPEDVAFCELASSMDETDAMALMALATRWLAWRAETMGDLALTDAAYAALGTGEEWMSGSAYETRIQKRADVLAPLLRDARFGALASCRACGGDSPEGCPTCVGGGA